MRTILKNKRWHIQKRVLGVWTDTGKSFEIRLKAEKYIKGEL